MKNYFLAAVAASALLFVAACGPGTFTYTSKEECLTQGGKWELKGTGHWSGAELPGCNSTVDLP